MSIDVKLPDLGDGIESGDVLEIYVAVGETVSKGQGLIELETDKATVSVPSPQAGKVSQILVAPGQSIAIGAVILQLEAVGTAPVAPAAKAPVTRPAATETTSAQTARAQQSAAPQAAVKPSPDRPAQSTKPSTAQSEANPAETRPTETKSVPDARASVPTAGSSKAATTVTQPQVDSSGEPLVAASPSVRRFAREVGVDLTKVQGSGDGGRITRDDVLRAVRESSSRANQEQAAVDNSQAEAQADRPAVVSAAATTGPKVVPLPGIPGSDDYGPVRVERLTKMRKTIATQMHKSWSTAPQVTNFDDADVTELEAFRISSKDDYAARGIKLTSMPFLIKAVANALRNHPSINAQLDMEKEQVIYHDYINVGVAVDTERGLVVPNIRNANQMSIPDIAKSLVDIASRVRSGDFSVGDLRGGTFTISNLGAIGGTYSTPIVNVPEVAILLAGRTRKLPVVMPDDSVRVRQMMPLSLSYDHRLVDGGTAARFLNDVITLLEAPSRLLLSIG